jgi:hypothetical protein
LGQLFVGSAWADFWDDQLLYVPTAEKPIFKGFLVFAPGAHHELNCSLVWVFKYSLSTPNYFPPFRNKSIPRIRASQTILILTNFYSKKNNNIYDIQ